MENGGAAAHALIRGRVGATRTGGTAPPLLRQNPREQKVCGRERTCCDASDDTSAPPCPSYTAKKDTSAAPGSPSAIVCASCG
jgi:hypothetical protein